MIRQLIRPDELARALGISKSKTYTLLQTGAIPSIRIGGNVRVDPSDLEKYLDQNRRDEQGSVSR